MTDALEIALQLNELGLPVFPVVKNLMQLAGALKAHTRDMGIRTPQQTSSKSAIGGTLTLMPLSGCQQVKQAAY